jgi:hypothetical protein
MVSLSILPLLVVLQQPTSAPSVASPAPVVTAPASDRLRPVRWSLLAVSIAADVQGLAVGIAAVHGVAAANNYRIYRQKGGR